MLETISEYFNNLDKEKIRISFYGLLILGILLAMFLIFKNNFNSNQEKYLTGEKKFNLALAMNAVGTEYGLTNNNQENQIKDYVNDSNNNLTTDLIQDVILTKIVLDVQNISNPETQIEIIKDVAQSYKDAAKGKIYTEADLNLNREENKEALQDYTDKLSTAIDNYFTLMTKQSQSFQNKLKLNSQASTTTKFNLALEEISQNILILNKTINELLTIPANASGAFHQLALINYFAENLAYFKSLTQTETDPMKYISLGGDNYLNQSQDKFIKIITDLAKYFNERGIIK